MTKTFHLSEAQNNESTGVIYFYVSLEVTVHEIVRDSDGFTMTSIVFPSSESLITVVFMLYIYAPNQDAQRHVSINGNSFGIII